MNEFEHLKALLLQDTEIQLDKVKRRIDDPESRHKDMAAVLPHALESAGRDKPKALQAALQEPVGDCVENAFNKTPKRFAKPLLPVMSQAIRNHFADVFKSLRGFLHEQQTEIQQQQQEIEQLQAQLQQYQQLQQALQGQIKTQQQQGQKQQAFVQQKTSKYARHAQKLEKQLAQLEQQTRDMETRTHELATILPDALRLAQQQESEESHLLSDALKAPIEKALRQSIENDTQTLANALFPIMGPAIRKSIEESIKELLKQINETVEQSMSLDGMRWRLEAMRSGKPYTQVMLQHTLIYRVEQVFLIHKESGLLMQHLYQGTNQTNTDADAVSAMLTAIQDFIRDSFSSEGDELNTVEMGKYTVWLERGPYTVLACVIQGVAPYEFRIQLREVQETLHQRHSQRLQHFSGDDSEVAVTRPVLEPILQEKLKTAPKNRLLNFFKKSIFWLLIFMLLFWLGKYQYDEWQQREAGEAYIQALQSAPGIAVTEYHWEDNILHISGLRDPLSQTPEDIAAAQNFEHSIQSYWSNYQDHAQDFKRQRLQQSLLSYPWPAGIAAELKDQVLYLRGMTEPETLAHLKKELSLFAGITQINTDALQLDDVAQRFQSYVEKLQQTPGVMVLNSGLRNGQYFIHGVRDPLAEDPNALADIYQIEDIHSQWQPYQDLTEAFVLKRLQLQLNPPDSVELSLYNGSLNVSGHANKHWIKRLENFRPVGVENIERSQLQDTDNLLLQQAREQLQDYPGIQLKVDDQTLYLNGHVNQHEQDKLNNQLPALTGFVNVEQQLEDEAILRQRLIKEIEQTGHIYFSGGAIMLPGQTDLLLELTEKLRLLFSLNRYLKTPVKLNLTGHTDQIGDVGKNIKLSHERAKTVRTWLLKRGITKTSMRLTLPDYLRKDKKTRRDTQIRLQQRRVDFSIKD